METMKVSLRVLEERMTRSIRKSRRKDFRRGKCDEKI